MKTSPAFSLFRPTVGLLGVVALLTTAALSAQTPSATGAALQPLQLVVIVPPAAQPMLEEDAADALSGVIQEYLMRRGYKGAVNYPGKGSVPPVLAVKLVEWRPDTLGTIKCTFTATIGTAAGTRELGMFTGSSLAVWNAGGTGLGRATTHTRDEAMVEAARDAMSDLTRKLAKDGSLPGFTHLKK